MEVKEGYEVGMRPPGLEEDGSFLVLGGVRCFSVVGDNGLPLHVDKATGLLVEADEDPDDHSSL